MNLFDHGMMVPEGVPLVIRQTNPLFAALRFVFGDH